MSKANQETQERNRPETVRQKLLPQQGYLFKKGILFSRVSFSRLFPYYNNWTSAINISDRLFADETKKFFSFSWPSCAVVYTLPLVFSIGANVLSNRSCPFGWSPLLGHFCSPFPSLFSSSERLSIPFATKRSKTSCTRRRTSHAGRDSRRRSRSTTCHNRFR